MVGERMRVVVVGAGLGGVSAAVGLHRAGHEVVLCERGAEVREAGTAVVIMPNGIRALDEPGLSDYVRSRVIPAVSGGLRDWRGRPLLAAAPNSKGWAGGSSRCPTGSLVFAEDGDAVGAGDRRILYEGHAVTYATVRRVTGRGG